MNKLLIKLFALLLVPCLAADPVMASVVPFVLHPEFSSLSRSNLDQRRFAEEALTLPSLAATFLLRFLEGAGHVKTMFQSLPKPFIPSPIPALNSHLGVTVQTHTPGSGYWNKIHPKAEGSLKNIKNEHERNVLRQALDFADQELKKHPAMAALDSEGHFLPDEDALWNYALGILVADLSPTLALAQRSALFLTMYKNLLDDSLLHEAVHRELNIMSPDHRARLDAAARRLDMSEEQIRLRHHDHLVAQVLDDLARNNPLHQDLDHNDRAKAEQLFKAVSDAPAIHKLYQSRMLRQTEHGFREFTPEAVDALLKRQQDAFNALFSEPERSFELLRSLADLTEKKGVPIRSFGRLVQLYDQLDPLAQRERHGSGQNQSERLEGLYASYLERERATEEAEAARIRSEAEERSARMHEALQVIREADRHMERALPLIAQASSLRTMSLEISEALRLARTALESPVTGLATLCLADDPILMQAARAAVEPLESYYIPFLTVLSNLLAELEKIYGMPRRQESSEEKVTEGPSGFLLKEESEVIATIQAKVSKLRTDEVKAGKGGLVTPEDVRRLHQVSESVIERKQFSHSMRSLITQREQNPAFKPWGEFLKIIPGLFSDPWQVVTWGGTILGFVESIAQQDRAWALKLRLALFPYLSGETSYAQRGEALGPSVQKFIQDLFRVLPPRPVGYTMPLEDLRDHFDQLEIERQKAGEAADQLFLAGLEGDAKTALAGYRAATEAALLARTGYERIFEGALVLDEALAEAAFKNSVEMENLLTQIERHMEEGVTVHVLKAINGIQIGDVGIDPNDPQFLSKAVDRVTQPLLDAIPDLPLKFVRRINDVALDVMSSKLAEYFQTANAGSSQRRLERVSEAHGGEEILQSLRARREQDLKLLGLESTATRRQIFRAYENIPKAHRTVRDPRVRAYRRLIDPHFYSKSAQYARATALNNQHKSVEAKPSPPSRKKLRIDSSRLARLIKAERVSEDVQMPTEEAESPDRTTSASGVEIEEPQPPQEVVLSQGGQFGPDTRTEESRQAQADILEEAEPEAEIPGEVRAAFQEVFEYFGINVKRFGERDIIHEVFNVMHAGKGRYASNTSKKNWLATHLNSRDPELFKELVAALTAHPYQRMDLSQAYRQLWQAIRPKTEEEAVQNRFFTKLVRKGLEETLRRPPENKPAIILVGDSRNLPDFCKALPDAFFERGRFNKVIFFTFDEQGTENVLNEVEQSQPRWRDMDTEVFETDFSMVNSDLFRVLNNALEASYSPEGARRRLKAAFMEKVTDELGEQAYPMALPGWLDPGEAGLVVSLDALPAVAAGFMTIIEREAASRFGTSIDQLPLGPWGSSGSRIVKDLQREPESRERIETILYALYFKHLCLLAWLSHPRRGEVLLFSRMGEGQSRGPVENIHRLVPSLEGMGLILDKKSGWRFFPDPKDRWWDWSLELRKFLNTLADDLHSEGVVGHLLLLGGHATEKLDVAEVSGLAEYFLRMPPGHTHSILDLGDEQKSSDPPPQSITGKWGGYPMYGFIMPFVEESLRFWLWTLSGTPFFWWFVAIFPVIHALLHIPVDYEYFKEYGWGKGIVRFATRIVLSAAFGAVSWCAVDNNWIDPNSWGSMSGALLFHIINNTILADDLEWFLRMSVVSGMEIARVAPATVEEEVSDISTVLGDWKNRVNLMYIHHDLQNIFSAMQMGLVPVDSSSMRVFVDDEGRQKASHLRRDLMNANETFRSWKKGTPSDRDAGSTENLYKQFEAVLSAVASFVRDYPALIRAIERIGQDIPSLRLLEMIYSAQLLIAREPKRVRIPDLGGWLSRRYFKGGEETTFEVSSDLPSVLVDEAALYRLLFNLVKNAQNAGAQHIKIKIEKDGFALHLSVADDGHGMDETKRARAQRVLAGLARDLFSTNGDERGVGLRIVRRAVAELGGKINVTSRPQKAGEHEFVTTFTMTVPIQVSDRQVPVKRNRAGRKLAAAA